MERLPLGLWLSEHRSSDDLEERSRRRSLSLLAEVADPFARTTFSPGHVTASAFVLSPDGDRVLLIRHRTLGRWLQPGGHVDPSDADIVAAARREVEEETGLRDLELAPGQPWLIDVDVHDIPANPAKGEPAHEHHDARVLFHAGSWELEDREEVAGVRWVPLADVASLDTDSSVLRVVAKLKERARRLTPLHSPAAERNASFIAEAGAAYVPPGATVWELGSGTGQHAQALSARWGVRSWVPSDVQEEGLESVRARKGGAVRSPRRIDLTAWPWWGTGGECPDVIYCANVIHIAPEAVLRGLMEGAGRSLKAGGSLLLYGPFRMGGTLTPESNVSFDASLRARDPAWGIRDLETVVEHAASAGLSWVASHSLPANNHLIVFRRRDDRAGLADPRAGELLDVWFGGCPEDPPEEVRRRWFTPDPSWDRELDERFGDWVDAAVAGGLVSWERTPRGRLALILLLDQLTRQRHRGTAEAFAGDERARRLTTASVRLGDPHVLTPYERHFLLMPWMHGESLEIQDLSGAAFRDLADESPELGGVLPFALEHREDIQRFGRFPYRNEALGRPSTAEEAAWLVQPPGESPAGDQ